MTFTEDDVDRAAAKVSDTLETTYSFSTGVPWEKVSATRRDYFRKIARLVFASLPAPEPRPIAVGDLVIDLPLEMLRREPNTVVWHLCRVTKDSGDGLIQIRDSEDDLTFADAGSVTRVLIDPDQPS